MLRYLALFALSVLTWNSSVLADDPQSPRVQPMPYPPLTATSLDDLQLEKSKQPAKVLKPARKEAEKKPMDNDPIGRIIEGRTTKLHP